MDEIHPHVSEKLDPWQKSWYSKWFYFQDEYDHVEDKNLEKNGYNNNIEYIGNRKYPRKNF